MKVVLKVQKWNLLITLWSFLILYLYLLISHDWMEVGNHMKISLRISSHILLCKCCLEPLYDNGHLLNTLLVKVCIDFNAVILKLKTCLGVTKDEYKKYKDLKTSYVLEIKVGNDETRNKFRTNKTPQLLEQILNEGRKLSSPVRYKYKPIWDIKLMAFYNGTTRHAIAMNLMQYYYGLKDFCCS